MRALLAALTSDALGTAPRPRREPERPPRRPRSRSRVVVGVVVAALTLGGAAIARGEAPVNRAPVAASRPAPTFEKDLSRVQHRLIAASKARVRCRNLGCINRSLNQLGSAVGVLGHAMFQCEQYVNVTRYGGYAFSSDGGASFGVSPAIDYTEEGDPVTNRVVVYVC
jgi:hypothetical protein